jgi:hypothetical protein
MNGASTQGTGSACSDQANVDTGTLNSWSLIVTPRLRLYAFFGGASATAGQLVISEFRVRGPSGANDEFVEI